MPLKQWGLLWTPAGVHTSYFSMSFFFFLIFSNHGDVILNICSDCSHIFKILPNFRSILNGKKGKTAKRPHYIHRKHKMFIDVCFRFENTVFLFSFYLLHNLTNFYRCLLYSLNYWTSSCTFFSFLLSLSFSGESNKEWNISNLSLL